MKVYEKIYNYYVEKIKDGSMKNGDRMPSLRESERILDVSRTSVENAYLQLAADGYIYSVEKVGFFVSDMVERIAAKEAEARLDIERKKKEAHQTVKYDLATIGEDKQMSCLNLWRRYMKSALRQEDRLLSYSENQGEEELREEVASYVRKNRNIICSPEDVVIGAGFQNLLQILIALIPGERTISFPTRDFADGATTFKNAGFQVNYRDKTSHVIYVTPSYMTKWGDVMTMKRRHELIDHARRDNHLIIEDDYQNEFVFSSKATPSLYAMTGGENVAFLGSFSRVLLPSVRISYIILPKGVGAQYREIRNLYNQTASKAEQIALAQFLRDGQLNRHIKKIKRLQEDKRAVAIRQLKKVFNDKQLLIGESGMEIGLRIDGDSPDEALLKKGIRVNTISRDDTSSTLLLTFSRIPQDAINEAVKKLSLGLQK